MIPALKEILAGHPVFASLADSVRGRLAAAATTKNYQAGETLTRSGECWPYLFVVRQGAIEVLKESLEGRSFMVAEIAAGELFWGVAFFQDGQPNPVTLRFSRPSTIYLWPRDVFVPFLLENGGLSWELSRLMAARMLRASEVIESLAFQPVAGRLARLLVDNFESTGGDAIARHLTLDEMAARVGTTREMVCRVLYRFADKKLITVTRTEFVLNDREGLTHMAEGS